MKTINIHITLFLFFTLLTSLAHAQLYTGSTLQFGGYSGGLSIGSPLPSAFSNTNLYIARTTSGTGLFVGNVHTGNAATAIGAFSSYGKSIEALTTTGYAIHGRSYSSTGYAGYFQGRTYASSMNIGSELTTPSLIAGTFTRSATALSVRADGSFPHEVANFQVGSNRLLLIGKSQSAGYNMLTQADDMALVFSDGQNNGGTNLSGGLSIGPWTSSTQAKGIRIDAEGKVGIGVSQPEYELDLRGDLRASGDVLTNGIVYDLAGNGLDFLALDEQGHTPQRRLRARLTPQGWLGLGAASPISPLEIRFDGGTANTRSAISLVAVDPVNEKSQISFRNPFGERMALGTDADGTGDNLFFIYNNQLAKHAITISESDNSTMINGNLVIGEKITSAGSVSYQDRLSIDGTMVCKGARVTMKGWHDYVFEDSYELAPLTDVADYIEQEGHLPGIPSEAEVIAEGVELGEMQGLLLKKIEELTLYVIALEKQVDQLQSTNK